jgi:DNA-binding transcriptional ArsR family regulator
MVRRRRSLRLQDAAPVFAALGDRTRLALVSRLGEGGPKSATELTAGVGVTRQAVTKHLQALEQAGLVHGERAGRERLWSLEQARIEQAQRWLDAISARWDARLERLRGMVEEDG